ALCQPAGELLRRKPADPGQEAARAGGVPPVGVAVDASQVGLLDQPHLDLQRATTAASMTAASTFGTRSANPSRVVAVAMRTGLRTNRNGPVVTSAPGAPGSTSGRHEPPIARCAASVPTVPRPTRATPVSRTEA